MKDYYIIINGKQVGPLKIEELVQAGLKKETYVWTPGMDNWKHACDVADMAPLLNPPAVPPVPADSMPTPVPPPVPAQEQEQAQAQNPDMLELDEVEVELVQYPQSQQPQPVQQQPAQQQPVQQQPVQQPIQQQPVQQPIQQQPAQQPAPATTALDEYQAVINGQTVGPFTKSQLAMSGLDYNVKIWRQGMPDWADASTVPEIAALLNNEPTAGAGAPERFYISVMAQNGFNTSNAYIYIFDDYITIRPQRATSVMFGNFSKQGYKNQYYGLEEIVGFEKGFMARKRILLTNDRKILIGVNGSKLFDAIERRRNAFAQKHGIALAPLKR